MVNKSEKDTNNGKISREAVEWVLKKIVHLPKTWIIVTSLLIILSTCEITLGKEFSCKFRVTNTTAVFLALIWLPSALKIFALNGGALKTPAGEIEGTGMINMLQSLTADSLGYLIEQTKLAEDVAPPQQQLEMRQIRHEWQRVYASKVPLSEGRQQIERLAQRYKEIRSSMSSGQERTFEMESVAGRMRALAPEVNFSVAEVQELLKSNDQGKRLLGLSVAEWSYDPIYFDLILNLIANPETAFEQTCALRAVFKMLDKLNDRQKNDLRSVLIRQRSYDPEQKRWIKPGSNRWLISDRLLSAL